MLKIRIITIHDIPNFGSVFQGYALCRYLISQGYTDTEIIDYSPKYYNKNNIRSLIGKLLNYKAYKSRAKKFRCFIEKYLPLTKKHFTKISQLERFDFSADVYIAGGDQLWNVYHDSGRDDAYKLTWVKAGKKISYATSMGQTGFTQNELEQLAEKILDFSAISVREKSSTQMLSKVGVRSVQCVDPVFLLDPSEYKKFIKPINQPRYLLVYLVTPSELLESCISYLSKKHGLKVILCSGFSKKCTCNQFLKDLGPDEILSYIYHADIVLSSSFHATAFSLIFKKQFFTILPDEHTNERIVDLLRMVEMPNRIIMDEVGPGNILRMFDISSLDNYCKLIEFSKKYLKGNLNVDA